uniref:Secreted protein n=1 Tax=Romanomermis culicivorax TaxID=13658 RepID=A0A915JYQ8_ROMCU
MREMNKTNFIFCIASLPFFYEIFLCRNYRTYDAYNNHRNSTAPAYDRQTFLFWTTSEQSFCHKKMIFRFVVVARLVQSVQSSSFVPFYTS